MVDLLWLVLRKGAHLEDGSGDFADVSWRIVIHWRLLLDGGEFGPLACIINLRADCRCLSPRVYFHSPSPPFNG